MKIPVEKEKLMEMQYDSGFDYMLRQGILYIEDMAIKKELGLEPDDAVAPTNVLVFNTAESMDNILKQPLWRFKQEIGKYSIDQCKNLADYMLENKLFDYEKCQIVKEITGIDVMKTYEFNKASEVESGKSNSMPNPQSGANGSLTERPSLDKPPVNK